MNNVTGTHRDIQTPYLRKMLAGELVGIRNFKRRSGTSADVILWMRIVADTCFGRMDLHYRKWGVGILTGESGGAWAVALPEQHGEISAV